jgi:hypothetical protein
MWRRASPGVPNNAPRQKRNDRIGRPATMDADSAHSSVAQASEVDAEWGL